MKSTKAKSNKENVKNEIGIMLDDNGVFKVFPSTKTDLERIVSMSHKRPRYNQLGNFSAEQFHIQLLKWIEGNITFRTIAKHPTDALSDSVYVARTSNENLICYVSTTLSCYIAELIRVCIENSIKLTLRYYNTTNKKWIDQEMVK